MRLYLKSGQVIELNRLNMIDLLDVQYGVGNYYENNKYDNQLYPQEVYYLCSQNKSNIIEFYYGDCETFITNTSEIVGVEV